MYDLIGDIHGHADSLVRLLTKLGYRQDGDGFRHPQRQAIFLGDFIDRGPKIAEVLKIARTMVESKAALAVMGNHEFNALAFHTPDPNNVAAFLRPHKDKNVNQHRATLEQVSAQDLASYLDWFRTLPLYLELPGLRVVHACWDDAAIGRIDHELKRHQGVTTSFLTEATKSGTNPQSQLFKDIEVVLKGPEINLPAGQSYLDKDGHERTAVRTRWYLSPEDKTYSTYGMTDAIVCEEQLEPEAVTAARSYPADAKPVFVGHYWLRAEQPERLAANVACLDYSVAKEGYLCAYRWDGEREIDNGKFVTTKD